MYSIASEVGGELTDERVDEYDEYTSNDCDIIPDIPVV